MRNFIPKDNRGSDQRSRYTAPSHFINTRNQWGFMGILILSLCHSSGLFGQRVNDSIHKSNTPSPHYESERITDTVPPTLAKHPIATDSIPKKNLRDSSLSIKIDTDNSPLPQKIDTIHLYRYYTERTGFQFIDTTLNFQNHHTQNLLRKDLFGIQGFANMGQGYQKLYFDLKYNQTPREGFPTKEWIYLPEDQVKYFDVISPTTQLSYQSGFEKGQATDITFTINLQEKWNTTFNYMGLNSLGKYYRSLADALRWYISSQYLGEAYRFKIHYIAQTILNEENGGLKDLSNFTSGDSDFLSRPRVPVNLIGTTTTLNSKRYYLHHEIDVIRSASLTWRIQNQWLYETKSLSFEETIANTDYHKSPAYNDTETNEQSNFNRFQATLGNVFSIGKLLDVETSIRRVERDYGNPMDSIRLTSDTTQFWKYIDSWSAIGKLNINLKKNMTIHLLVDKNISGNDHSINQNIKTTGSLTLKKWGAFTAEYGSFYPDFIYQKHRSNYKEYHWENKSLKSTEYVSLSLKAKYRHVSTTTGVIWDNKLVINFHEIYNQYYLDKQMKPKNNPLLQIISSTWSSHWEWKQLGNDFRLTTQKSLQNQNESNPLPSYIVRNTLYFQSMFFEKALYLRTGLEMHRFASYYMQAYSPLLSNKVSQSNQSIGGYNVLNFFVNMKIKTMRIYIKYEHFNSGWGGYDFWSSPSYPYTDDIIRVGIDWLFFD